jgi:hypothetical protein
MKIEIFTEELEAKTFVQERCRVGENWLICPAKSVWNNRDQVFIFPVAFSEDYEKMWRDVFDLSIGLSENVKIFLLDSIEEIRRTLGGGRVVAVDRWGVDIAAPVTNVSPDQWGLARDLASKTALILSKTGSEKYGEMPLVPVVSGPFDHKEKWLHLGLE